MHSDSHQQVNQKTPVKPQSFTTKCLLWLSDECEPLRVLEQNWNTKGLEINSRRRVCRYYGLIDSVMTGLCLLRRSSNWTDNFLLPYGI
jgi:hypothetical protein